MTSLGRATCVTVMLALAGSAGAGSPQASPRAEIEALARRLEQAVRQVSLPSSEPLLGVDEARGYYMPGLGAVFVVPPRAVPRPTRVLLLAPGQPTVVVDSPDDQAELEALLGPDEARRVSAGRRRPRSAHEMELDQRTEEFRRWAQEASREMEMIFDQWMRGQVGRPLVRPMGTVAAADAAPSSGATLPGLEADASAPGTPGPPPSGALPDLPREALPPAAAVDPLGATAPDLRSPDAVVQQVRQALVAALEAHGASLRSLRADELVSVAVDFVPRGLFAADPRPARTLVVRVSKKALDDRAAGRVDGTAFGKLVQFSEY